MLRVLPLVLATGCLVGGGPVAGYGEHGFVYGAEVNGGLSVLNGVIGYQNEQHVLYGAASFDSGLADLLAFDNKSQAIGRGGLGVGVSTGDLGFGSSPDYHRVDTGNGGAHGIVLTGLGFSRSLGERASCDDYQPVLVATVELRYVTQFEVVLVPRVEGYMEPCF